MNKLKDLLSGFKTYPWDEPLLKSLGLKPFKGKNWEEIYLGEFKDGQGSIKIWVKGAPAQFWKFEIFCNETKTVTKVSTGSGSLTEYWPCIKKIQEGMLVLEGEK